MALGPPTLSEVWPASWYPDPTLRHEMRYWDGGAWTDQVADQGAATTNRLDPRGKVQAWIADHIEGSLLLGVGILQLAVGVYGLTTAPVHILTLTVMMFLVGPGLCCCGVIAIRHPGTQGFAAAFRLGGPDKVIAMLWLAFATAGTAVAIVALIKL